MHTMLVVAFAMVHLLVILRAMLVDGRDPMSRAAWLLAVIATGMNVANIAVTSQLIVMGLLLIVSIVATNAIYARSQR